MLRYRMLKGIALLACLYSATTQASLIKNGSFETPPTGTSFAYTFFPAQTYGQLASNTNVNSRWGVFASLPEWTSLYGDQIELNLSGNAPGLNAQTGDNFVELDSHFKYNVADGTYSNQSNVGIAQTVSGLTVGARYELSFWYRARTTEADDNLLDIYWLPASQQTQFANFKQDTVDYNPNLVVGNRVVNNNAEWAQYSYVFKATSTEMLLGFGGAGNKSWRYQGTGAPSINGNKSGALLDNISLNAITSPSTFGIFAFASLAVLWIRRFRQ